METKRQQKIICGSALLVALWLSGAMLVPLLHAQSVTTDSFGNITTSRDAAFESPRFPGTRGVTEDDPSFRQRQQPGKSPSPDQKIKRDLRPTVPAGQVPKAEQMGVKATGKPPAGQPPPGLVGQPGAARGKNPSGQPVRGFGRGGSIAGGDDDDLDDLEIQHLKGPKSTERSKPGTSPAPGVTPPIQR